MRPTSKMSHGTPRSPLGLFSPSDEPDVFRSVADELRRRGPEEIGRLIVKYQAAVDGPDRRGSVEALLKNIENSSTEDYATALPLITEFLYFAADQLTLSKHRLLFPAYNTQADYDFNKVAPWGPMTVTRPTTSYRWRLFGRDIDFPIGIGASPLTANSRWISYWAACGYNVITYKTVRSRETNPHPIAPHWVLLRDEVEPFVVGQEPAFVSAESDDWCVPGDPNISSANSFGIPSEAPPVWQEDVARALQGLYADQLLIVSVLGDLYVGDPHTREQLARDFLDVARKAYDAGARIIELNLSCPNLLDESRVQPPLCQDRELTTYVVQYVRDNMPADTMLVAKLSYLASGPLRLLMKDIAPAISGISGINTLQRPVLRRDAATPAAGSDTFPGRHEAGVSGIAIREHARQFVTDVTRLRDEFELDLSVIGMGGVTSPESFEQLILAGADAVQAVTGVFANPMLASDSISLLADRLEELHGRVTLPAASVSGSEIEVQELTRAAVLKVLEDLGKASTIDIIDAVGVRVGRTLSVLDNLRDRGEVAATRSRGETFYQLAGSR